MKWTKVRDTALLTQIISTGVKAFVTHKANTPDLKESERWNQGTAWTGEDGIITMLKKHEAFEGVNLSTAFAGTAAVALTSDDVVHPEGLPWEHLGLFSAYDCGALRRGFQVYRQVCASCQNPTVGYFLTGLRTCRQETFLLAVPQEHEMSVLARTHDSAFLQFA